MLKRNVQKLISEANAVIETISVHQALELLNDSKTLLVDVREHTERAKSGTLPGALHAPRSHLEFLADPDAALHMPELASDKRLVLFCASGGRSTLAAKTLTDMGVPNVSHIAGGFSAWRDAGGLIEGGGE